MSISNWNGSVHFTPQSVQVPKTPEELQAIITNPALPSPLRALGELHSLNEAAATDGTAIYMRHFDKKCPPRLGPNDQMTVTVGAGVRMIDLMKWLKPYRLQLEVVPEIGNATAGSVACCGTKDSSLGRGPGQISSGVVSLRMIKADGSDWHVTAENDLEEVRSSYGLFGVIYEVTFRVVKRVKVTYSYPIVKLGEKWLDKGDPLPAPDSEHVLGKKADGFLGFLLPRRRRLIVERRRIVKNPWRMWIFDDLKAWARKFAWTTGARPFMGLLRPLPRRWQHGISTAWAKWLEGVGLDFFFMTFLGRYSSWRADAMIDFKRPVSSYFEFTFWAFPARDWGTIVPDFFKFIQEFEENWGFRPRLPVEVYFIQQDDRAALSFCPDGAIFTLDLVNWTDEEPALWKKLNVEFNEFAARHGGRPLLNQTKHLSPEVAQHLWRQNPGWDRIARARRRHDPHGRFLTPFFEQRLP
jgi:FAD/FMN-containing dehydrogenase